MNSNRQKSSSLFVLYSYLLLLSSSSAFTTISHHHAGLSLRQTQFCSSPSQIMSRSTRAITKSSNWQMHMGHSHTHNHHHHGDDTTSTKAVVKKIPMKRKITRILFAAVVTLLPPLLLKQRRINRINTALFVLTSTALSFTERLRTEVQGLLLKAQTWRAGFIKHAPPLYFQTDNAADRVTLVGVIINLLLSIGKAIVGITCHSSALIADAGHSLSDLFSDFITLWAVQIARLPPDDDHPYGHGKFEAVGSLFLALTLFGTGISVGAASNSKLLQILQHSKAAAATTILKLPTWPALVMAALSIGSKEWLYRITRRVGEELNSQVVIANAWHHRSDAYSSILALGSIGLAMIGLPAADAAAGILVAGMICMTGAEIFGEAVKQLTDTSDELLEQRVKEEILGQEDVLGVERIRTRWMGSKALVDIAITTPMQVSASANKAIENRVRQSLLDLERGVLVDADVRASPQDELTCPLLTASSIEHREDTSVTNVEHEAREMLENHADVASIERCTVRYEDTLNAVVDVNIRVVPELNQISDATALASDLRTTLEQSDYIYKANIYLDLNPQPTNNVIEEEAFQ